MTADDDYNNAGIGRGNLLVCHCSLLLPFLFFEQVGNNSMTADNDDNAVISCVQPLVVLTLSPCLCWHFSLF